MAPQNQENINQFQEGLSKIEKKENLSYSDCEFLAKGLNDSISLLEKSENFDDVMKLQTLETLKNRLADIGKNVYENGGASKEYSKQITEIVSDLKNTLLSMQVTENTPSIPTPERFGKPTSKPSGLGQLEVKSEEEKLLDSLDNAQKGELFKQQVEKLKTLPLTKSQLLRINQTEVITVALDSIFSEIKNKRTVGAQASQMLDTLSDLIIDDGSDARKALTKINIEQGLMPKVIRLLVENPEMTLDEAFVKVDSNVKSILKEYGLQKKRGAYGKEGTILDPKTLKFKDPQTLEDLQEQYLALVEFLRNRKDYEGVKTLVEDRLLKDYFTREREKLAVKEKGEIRKKALTNTSKILSEAYKVWETKKIPKEMQLAWAQVIEEEQIERAENMFIMSRGDKMFNEVSGNEYKTLNVYKTSKGIGEWYELSDETWDTIIREIAINGPLLIISGGIANLAKAGLSGAAKMLLVSQRFASITAKLGLTAMKSGKIIKVTATVVEVTAEGAEVGSKLGRNMLALGNVAGVLVEGATFDIVHTAMTNPEALISRDLPEWGKSIFWSSLTLGTFHFTGAQAGKINELLAKSLEKAPKSVTETFTKLLSFSSETATMFGISALQHLVGTGDYKFEDFKVIDQLLHSMLAVGSLKISGKIVGDLKTKVIPRRTKTVEIRTETDNTKEIAAKKTAEKPTEMTSEAPSSLKDLPPELATKMESALKKANLKPEWLEISLEGLEGTAKVEAVKSVVEKLDGEFGKGKKLDSQQLLERLKNSKDIAEITAIEIAFRSAKLKLELSGQEIENLFANKNTAGVAGEALLTNISKPEVFRYIENKAVTLRTSVDSFFEFFKEQNPSREAIEKQNALYDSLVGNRAYKMVVSLASKVKTLPAELQSKVNTSILAGSLALVTTGCEGNPNLVNATMTGLVVGALAWTRANYWKALPRKQLRKTNRELIELDANAVDISQITWMPESVRKEVAKATGDISDVVEITGVRTTPDFEFTSPRLQFLKFTEPLFDWISSKFKNNEDGLIGKLYITSLDLLPVNRRNSLKDNVVAVWENLKSITSLLYGAEKQVKLVKALNQCADRAEALNKWLEKNGTELTKGSGETKSKFEKQKKAYEDLAKKEADLVHVEAELKKFDESGKSGQELTDVKGNKAEWIIRKFTELQQGEDISQDLQNISDRRNDWISKRASELAKEPNPPKDPRDSAEKQYDKLKKEANEAFERELESLRRQKSALEAGIETAKKILEEGPLFKMLKDLEKAQEEYLTLANDLQSLTDANGKTQASFEKEPSLKREILAGLVLTLTMYLRLLVPKKGKIIDETKNTKTKLLAFAIRAILFGLAVPYTISKSLPSFPTAADEVEEKEKEQENFNDYVEELLDIATELEITVEDLMKNQSSFDSKILSPESPNTDVKTKYQELPNDNDKNDFYQKLREVCISNGTCNFESVKANPVPKKNSGTSNLKKSKQAF